MGLGVWLTFRCHTHLRGASCCAPSAGLCSVVGSSDPLSLARPCRCASPLPPPGGWPPPLSTALPTDMSPDTGAKPALGTNGWWGRALCSAGPQGPPLPALWPARFQVLEGVGGAAVRRGGHRRGDVFVAQSLHNPVLWTPPSAMRHSATFGPCPPTAPSVGSGRPFPSGCSCVPGQPGLVACCHPREVGPC